MGGWRIAFTLIAPLLMLLLAGCGGMPVSEVTAALRAAARVGDLAAVQRLIEAGARIDGIDEQGNTALHGAIAEGELEVAALLLARGAQTMVARRDGDTALHIATRNGDLRAVALLMEHKASATQRGRDGASALQLAVEADDAGIVNRMAAGGADVNLPNAIGDTPLHVAAKKRKLFAAGALLAAGATVSGANALGDTPLHLSVYGGQPELTRQLAGRGASAEVLNTYGLNPAEMAALPALEIAVVELVALLNPSGNWTDANGARPKFESLKKHPQRFLVNALVLQVVGGPDRRARTVTLALKLGIAGSEEKLGALLMTFGDRPWAEDYLNAGSAVLHGWAERWAAARGYTIRTGPGSHRATWGRF